jgi:F-box and WD-40 domain protein CDC4
LIDRENHQDSRYEEDGDDLDLKKYPLSQTEWDASGLGNFKVELGDLTARFQHDPSSGKGKGKGKSVTAGRTSVDKAVDVKGKGKERQQNDGSEIIGSSKSGTIDSRRLSSPTTTTFLGDRRSSTVNTRGSPGPPPRKRPRSDAHDMEEGADENVKMKTVSLPSPNQSPPSPVPTSGGGDDSQDTFLPNLDASFDQPRPPSVPLQNFNLGQSPAIPALLSLPDLVDTFDQLSPSLQSYLIFSLLRRSSIPVLQTVANIISPALRRDFLSDLPPELSVQILGYLDPTTLCRASLVCKNWRKLVDGEWRIWKRMMDQDGLWIGDGSEEKEAREIVTGKKENWFLKRWKAGVWDQNKVSFLSVPGSARFPFSSSIR